MSKLSATDQIINYIKENILNGNFKINSKLPSERKIAEQFNISRIPVRKAIEKLCEDGIIRTVPYSKPLICLMIMKSIKIIIYRSFMLNP